MRNLIKPLLLVSVLATSVSGVFAAPGEKYPQTKTRVLSTTEVANLNTAQRRYAINEIYARHGLLFGDMEIRRNFLKFNWYKPQPGQSMAVTKSKFTRIERQNVERLGLARELEQASTKADDYEAPSVAADYHSPYAGTSKAWKGEHFPETRLVRLDFNEVLAMSDSQKRYAINEIYARRGYLFQEMALRKQFLGSSWYKPKPGRSMKTVASTLTAIEKANLSTLTAARAAN
ncbi:YARHG domain-containing protein [bacterium]|nr:MAG: YARHG domain-containing protein [bacterium]